MNRYLWDTHPHRATQPTSHPATQLLSHTDIHPSIHTSQQSWRFIFAVESSSTFSLKR